MPLRLPTHSAQSTHTSPEPFLAWTSQKTSSHICLRKCIQGCTYLSMRMYDGLMAKAPRNFDLAPFFAALSDPTRLRLLNLMNGREVCVCYFVEILKQGQPKISRHLAYLRSAGIVSARREGKWMHYSLDRPA